MRGWPTRQRIGASDGVQSLPSMTAAIGRMGSALARRLAACPDMSATASHTLSKVSILVIGHLSAVRCIAFWQAPCRAGLWSGSFSEKRAAHSYRIGQQRLFLHGQDLAGRSATFATTGRRRGCTHATAQRTVGSRPSGCRARTATICPACPSGAALVATARRAFHSGDVRTTTIGQGAENHIASAVDCGCRYHPGEALYIDTIVLQPLLNSLHARGLSPPKASPLTIGRDTYPDHHISTAIHAGGNRSSVAWQGAQTDHACVFRPPKGLTDLESLYCRATPPDHHVTCVIHVVSFRVSIVVCQGAQIDHACRCPPKGSGPPMIATASNHHISTGIHAGGDRINRFVQGAQTFHTVR